VPIQLSEIELHYYNDTLDRQRHLLRLSDAEVRPDDWYFDRALFRTCLMNLRQICTHIQVGAMQAPAGRGERIHLGKELMTMSEALERMKNDHNMEYMVESRSQVSGFWAF
jgi:E3 ubiquitin-protein ligase SHPRH